MLLQKTNLINMSGALSSGTNELMSIVNRLPKERLKLPSDTDELSLS